MKSNTQVELHRNFEKLRMIHKQELRSLQSSGKPSEIKLEIAFIMIKLEIHTLRMFTLRNSKREKFGFHSPLENRIPSNINLTLTNVKRY